MKIKYEKPTIRKVKLVPSEAVLAACKNDASSGPALSSCFFVQRACSNIGS